MVRTSLVASLLAAAASSLAAKSVVPGAYIFELENDQDVSAFEQTMTGDGKTRMKLEYELFTGLSVQLKDLKTAKQTVAKYAAMPAACGQGGAPGHPLRHARPQNRVDRARGQHFGTIRSWIQG
ncbi:hypothetical protein E4U57_005973 [Claviceps arundinis]|uniref:Uncharacterized protein n=1 Tax=Claviceps arundinis TaxID=1623583 RepID=A0ABQ7P2G8_9HYPO|nr:hypothetical protein E4U57_005973 [Claviceps arundinis]